MFRRHDKIVCVYLQKRNCNECILVCVYEIMKQYWKYNDELDNFQLYELYFPIYISGKSAI